jgi:hypothetical protein
MYYISNLTRKSIHATRLSSICAKTTDYEIINLTKCNMYMDDTLQPDTSLIHMLKMKIIHKSAEKIFNGMLQRHQNSSC